MKKINERIKNLDEKIYTMCYSKPRYSSEIKQALYSTDTDKHPSVSRMITKMIEKNEILNLTKEYGKKKHDGAIPVTLSNKKIPFIYETTIPNGKGKIREYYLSSIEPVFDAILTNLKEKNIKFEPNEKYTIKELLGSKEYRNAIGYAFESRIKDYRTDLDPLFFIATNFCNTASILSAVDVIRNVNGISKKTFLKKWDKFTDSFIRKEAKKNKLLSTTLKSMGESVTTVINHKEFGKLFIEKTNNQLLQKLMKLDPSCRYNQWFVLMGASIHTRKK